MSWNPRNNPYDDIVDRAVESPSEPKDVDDLIDFYSKKNGVDPDLTRRIVHQESGGRRTATSPKGAQGLMQLMPDTGRGLGVTDPFDPHQNLDAGTRYLKQQLDEFGTPDLALAAYNAGPGAVRKYGKKIPPYRETQNYVKTILTGYKGGPSTGSNGSAYDEIVDAAVTPLTKRQQAQAAMAGNVSPVTPAPAPVQKDWRELVADVRDRAAATEARKPQPPAVIAPTTEPEVGEARPLDLETGGMTPADRAHVTAQQQKYSQIDAVANQAYERLMQQRVENARRRQLEQQAAARRRQAQQAMGQQPARPLTVEDAAWHMDLSQAEARQLKPEVLRELAQAVAADEQKRAAGQPVERPSFEARNEMRRRVGLTPLSAPIAPQSGMGAGELRRLETHSQPAGLGVGELRRIEGRDQQPSAAPSGGMAMGDFRRSEERAARLAREIRPQVVKDYFSMGAGVRQDIPTEVAEQQIASNPQLQRYIEEETLRRADALEERERAVSRVERGAAPTLGLVDKLRELKNNPAQLIPFMSSVPEIGRLVHAGQSIEKLEKNEPLTAEEEVELREVLAANRQDKSLMYQVADVISGLPSFAGELALTGGLYSAGRRAALKGLEKIATKEGLARIESKLIGRLATKSVASLAGAAAQTLPASATRIPAGVLYRQQSGADFATALKDTLIDQFIEVASERTGGVLGHIPLPKKLSAIRDAVTARWIQRVPGRTAAQLQKLVERTGWHGPLGEVFEERVGDVAHYAAGQQDSPVPTLEQLAVEGLAFSAPGVGEAALNKALQFRAPRTARAEAEEPVTPPTPATPRAEEKIGTLDAQIAAMMQSRGNRKAVIHPSGTSLAEEAKQNGIPAQLQGVIDMAVGPNGEVAIFKPSVTPRAVVEALLDTGRANELTGLPNPESEKATLVAVARVAEGPNKGEERLAGYIEPDKVDAFRQEALAQFPDETLSFEFGGKETEKKVLADRQPDDETFERFQAAETPLQAGTKALFKGKPVTVNQITGPPWKAGITGPHFAYTVDLKELSPIPKSPAPDEEQEQPSAAVAAAAKPSATPGVVPPASETTPTPAAQQLPEAATTTASTSATTAPASADRGVENLTVLRQRVEHLEEESRRLMRATEPGRETDPGYSENLALEKANFQQLMAAKAQLYDAEQAAPKPSGESRERRTGERRVERAAPEGYANDPRRADRRITPQRRGPNRVTDADWLELPEEERAKIRTQLEAEMGPPTADEGQPKRAPETIEEAVARIQRQAAIDQYLEEHPDEQTEEDKARFRQKAIDRFDAEQRVAERREYVQFPAESGTLGIARAAMPQIKSEHRGALANRLKARGISYTEEEVLPDELKPSQAEYSPAKVEKARGWTGPERKLLVSSDNYVLDGHHQWMQKLEDFPDRPIPIIRLSVPAREALLELSQFPSSEVQGAHGETSVGQSTTSPETKEKSEDVRRKPVSTRAARGDEARATKEGVEEKEEKAPAAKVEGVSGQPEVDWSEFSPNTQGYQARELSGLDERYFVAQQSPTQFDVIESERGATRATAKKTPDGWALSVEGTTKRIAKGVFQSIFPTGRTFETPQAAILEFNNALHAWEHPERVPLTTYEIYQGNKATHRTAIANALRASRSVPDQVLADYPDLKEEAERARPVRSDQEVDEGGPSGVQREGSEEPRVSDLRGEGQRRKPVKSREGVAERSEAAPVAQAPEGELTADDVSALFDQEVARIAEGEKSDVVDVQEQVVDWATRLRRIISSLHGEAPTGDVRQQLEQLLAEGQRFRDRVGAKDATFTEAMDSLAAALGKPAQAEAAPSEDLRPGKDLDAIYRERSGKDERAKTKYEKDWRKQQQTTARPQAVEKPSQKFPPALAKRLLALPNEQRATAYGPSNKMLRREIYFTLTGDKATDKNSGSGAITKLLATHFGIDLERKAPVEYEDEIVAKLREVAGLPAEPSRKQQREAEDRQTAIKARQRKAEEEGELKTELPISEADIDSMESIKETGSASRGKVTVRVIEMESGSYGVEVQMGVAKQRPLPGTGKPLEQAQVEAVERLNARAPLTQEAMRAMYDEINDGSWDEVSAGEEAKTLWETIPADADHEFTQDDGFKMVRIIKAIKAGEERRKEEQEKSTAERDQLADMDKRAEKGRELATYYSVPGLAKHWLTTIDQKGEEQAKQNLRRNVTDAVMGWTDDPEWNAIFHGDIGKDFNHYIDVITDQVFNAIKATRQPAAEAPKPREPAREKAIGVIAGGAVAALEKKGWTIAYGDIGKGDRYYDVVGVISGGPADQFRDAGLTILYGTEADKVQRENEPTPEWWNDLTTAGKRELLKAAGLSRYIGDTRVVDWKNMTRGEQHAVVTQHLAGQARAADPEAEDRARLQELEGRRFKTAMEEQEVELIKARLAADPSKWKVGDGVGYRVYGGGRSQQINRGFRITEIDVAAKLARLKQVADTGLTVTGGADRLGDTWVHISDLVRDKKYNAPAKQVEPPTSAPPTTGESTYDRALAAYKKLLPTLAQPVLDKNAKRMADVIDNRKAGDDLLRTNNKISRKVFTELTGIDLGKTERDAVEAVENWASAKEEPEEAAPAMSHPPSTETGDYRTEIVATGETKWATNNKRYATPAEANKAGNDLFMRWFGADDYRVVHVSTPLNEKVTPDQLRREKSAEALEEQARKDLAQSDEDKVTKQMRGETPTLAQRVRDRVLEEAGPVLDVPTNDEFLVIAHMKRLVQKAIADIVSAEFGELSSVDKAWLNKHSDPEAFAKTIYDYAQRDHGPSEPVAAPLRRITKEEAEARWEKAKAEQAERMKEEAQAPVRLNGYISFYKGKQLEVYAPTPYAASQEAAKHFKAKKQSDVRSELAEKDVVPPAGAIVAVGARGGSAPGASIETMTSEELVRRMHSSNRERVNRGEGGDGLVETVSGTVDPYAVEYNKRRFGRSTAPTKPSLASATKALGDIFDEEEETEVGTAQFSRTEPEFDDAKYALAEPQFIIALQSFQNEGLTLAQSVPRLVRHFNTEAGYSAAKIARMKPYVVRFVLNVQAGKVDLSTRETTAAPLTSAQSSIETLAQAVTDKLNQVVGTGSGMNNAHLRDMAEKAFGGTIAQGTYTVKDAYDALELGVNHYLLTRAPDMLADDPQQALLDLREVMSALPRQTDRTAETDQLQQFSTPPTLAFIAAKALNIQPTDVVEEPSAGTGNLALWAKAAGATVETNEISPRRRKILEAMGFSPTSVDAELLNDLLPLNIKPTAILMNPPFSATGGRTASNDTKYGARHIEQALLRLENGGRAVIITGEGMAIGKHKFSDWWKRMMSRYNVRANLSIPGDEYGKYGTTFGTQLLVIDKTGPTPGTSPSEQLKNVRFGDVTSLEVALNELESIIADRPALKPASSSVATDRGDVRGGLGEPTPAPSRGSEPAGPGRPGPVTGEDGPSESIGGDTSVLGGKPGTRPARPQKPRPIRSGGRGAEDVRLTDGLTGTTEPDFVPTDLGLVYSRRTETRETEEGGTFVRYSPAKLGGAMVHPADIVESASMAAVEPPDITHVPHLPPAIVTEGKLSDLQLESVSYAGQRFKQRLPSGARAGYFIGDGTGVGKGREVSGIILDEWNQGNQRALWLSVSRDLIEDASRDLKDIGAGHLKLASISDYAPADDITLPKGVIFSTYNSLISAAKTGSRQKRREQLEQWLGDDGVIILDEAHKAKNALGQGQSEPTQTGQAVIDLQANLPNARVVYASATGATDVRNMAYMTRLGLWGPGTSFPGGFIEFMGEIDRGGVGAMEMVSRDMKALGMYASRSISFNGVDYQETIHELAAEQRHIYDTAANAMQVVLQNIGEALGITNASKRAKMMAMQRFWADHQRLFRQLISSFKVPTVIRQTEKALAEGKSVVIGLIGTGESRTKEQVTKALSVGGDLEDLDFSPREFIANMIDKAFPVNVYQEVTDEETGQTTVELVRDEDGNPVVSQEALRLKEAMLDQLSDLHLPENPLDQIVNYFGERQVAEMTGRKRRLMRGPDGKMAYKKRAPDGIAMTRVNVHENRQFQSGKKHIAIISDAAATGISLHASNREENKQRRVHMTLELGWSADKQMQTFGRTHRSDQAIPPEYDLISTDIGGEKRFSSTIARRLASLGALTKGQRDATGGGDLAKYNFETQEGKAALTRFYSNIMAHESIEGVENPRQALKDMGILKERADGESISDDDMVDVPRFLNRILALDLNRQNVLFNRFTTIFEQTIDFAKENGTFDEGVADIKGESIRLKGDPQVVHRDETTGAETTHHQLDIDVKTEPVDWERAKKVANFHKTSGFYKQNRSGNIIVADEAASHTDPATGFVFTTYAVTTPQQERDHFIRDSELNEKYSKIKEAEAKPWWLESFNKVPPIRTVETHVIGGAILPLWQRLKTDEGARLKVVRVMTDEGQRVVGIQIPNKQVASVLRSIGVGRELKTPEEVFTAVLDQDDVVKLVGGLVLAKARLHNDDAIEVRGADYNKFEQLRQMGLINERIDWKQRFFIPTNMETGVPALQMLLGSYPVIDMRSEEQAPPESEPQFSGLPRGWDTAEAGPAEDPEFSVQGNHISLNLAALQLLNDAYQSMKKYKMPSKGIGGVFERQPSALVQALEDIAEQQPERAGVRELASAVRKAGTDGRPVSLAYGETQRRHEEIHRSAFESSGGMGQSSRLSEEGFTRLEAHPSWATIKDSLLRKNYPDNTPVLVDEAFAYLATGDNLGLSDEDADSFIEAWLREFKEKNGNVSITKFKELSDGAEKARQRVYAEGETVDRSAGSSLPVVSDRGLEGTSRTHEEGARGEPWQQSRVASGLTENEHRLVVAQALNTSKDVPATVLREYPGLAESVRFEQAQMAEAPLQTDTEAFKRWFGDSKVVDKNGNPLAVYHRSPFKFTAFDKREIIHFGFHFGTLKQARAVDMGGTRGNLYQGYLKIENPLRLPDLGSWDTDTVVEELRKRHLITNEQDNELDTAFNPEQQLWEIIKSHGYDGIVYENLGETEVKDKKKDIFADSYIVPEPTQFKSTKNVGSFDPNNPSMLFAEHEDPWSRLLKLAEDLQRPEGQQSRKLPKTFEAAQMETGENLFYTPTTVDTGIELGKEMVANKGIDGAMEFVRTGDGIGWASTGYEVLAQLRADEAKARPSDPQAADAIAEKRLKFLDEFVERATELGRAIVGIKAIEIFAPDRAAYHLNKLSQRRRKHGISPEEEKQITEMAMELQRINDQLKATEQQIEYRKQVARELEEELAAEKTRSRRRGRYQPGEGGEGGEGEQRRSLMKYEVSLEERAQEVKDTLLVKLGNLDFGNLKVSAGKFPKQTGAVGPQNLPLPADAELLAQYTAGQLATFNTVADLNAHLLETFGQEVEPYLPAIRQRSYQIRREARAKELADKETSAPRRRTILAEIQAEIIESQRVIRETEAEHAKAERERERKEKLERKEADDAVRRAQAELTKARNREMKAEAQERLRQAREEQREKGRTKPIEPKSARRIRLDEIKEAKQRKAETEREYKRASEADVKAWREENKRRREAARKAELWDTPIREAAAAARERLATATDPKDPQVMEDLTAVAAEKFLPDKPGGPVRKKAVDPAQVYIDLLDEFPNLVNKKNQGEVYRRGYQRILDATAAAREAATMRAAQGEEQRLWEQMGVDTEAQALLIQRATQRRQQQELRHKMQEEFERVGRSKLQNFFFELNSFPRSAKSSIDAPELRQGLLAFLTHPLAIAPTVSAAAKGYAAIHPAEYNSLVEELQRMPRYDQAHRSGLDLPEIVGETDARVHTEEMFQSGWGQKVPHIRVSEQAFVLSMNTKRMTLWNLLAPTGEAHGYTLENNPEFFKQLASFINDVTGRGNVPESMARFMSTWLNWFFFAPRYNISKVQLLNDLFNPFKYISAEWAPQVVKDIQSIPGFSPYDPVMRKIAAEHVVRWFAAMVALYIAASLLGFSITLDPEDADFFPKIRWGNTSYDLSGGEVGTVRFLYRFLKGLAKLTAGKPVSKYESPYEIALGRRGFFRQKLSPWAGGFVDYVTGTSVTGKPTTLSMPVTGWYKQGFIKTMQEDILVNMITPIVVGDFLDGAADSGWLGVGKTAPALLGLGVQTYPRKEKPSGTKQLMSEKLQQRREETPEEKARKELKRQLEEDVRQGKPVVAEVEKAVREGKLLPSDRAEIARSATLKPEQLTFKDLGVVEAMDVYEAPTTTDEERAMFKQLLEDKGVGIWNLPEPEQDAAAARFKTITGKEPPTRRRRKFSPRWYMQLQNKEKALPTPAP